LGSLDMETKDGNGKQKAPRAAGLLLVCAEGASACTAGAPCGRG
jgi:hypothetical protein